MKKLTFYDLKTKKQFDTSNYRLVEKVNAKTKVKMIFAVAKNPSGTESWRIIGRA